MERDILNNENIEHPVIWLTSDEFAKLLNANDNIISQAKLYVYNYTMRGADGIEWQPYKDATENQCIALYCLKEYIESITEVQYVKLMPNKSSIDISSEFYYEPKAFLNYCFWNDKYPIFKITDVPKSKKVFKNILKF